MRGVNTVRFETRIELSRACKPNELNKPGEHKAKMMNVHAGESESWEVKR